MFSPGPRPIDVADVTALAHFTSLEAFNSPVHKVEVTALDKPGVGRIYAVRRWVLFDESKMHPMVPPKTDVEEHYVDAETATSHLNRLADETFRMDAHMMGP